MLFDFWKRKKAEPIVPALKAVTVKAANAANAPPMQINDPLPVNTDMASLAVSSGADAFPQLGERELLALYKVSKVRKLEAGKVLYSESDPVDYFYLVIKGEIRLLRHAPGTNQSRGRASARCGRWSAVGDSRSGVLWYRSAYGSNDDDPGQGTRA